jgi:hypothetical protein
MPETTRTASVGRIPTWHLNMEAVSQMRDSPPMNVISRVLEEFKGEVVSLSPVVP